MQPDRLDPADLVLRAEVGRPVRGRLQQRDSLRFTHVEVLLKEVVPGIDGSPAQARFTLMACREDGTPTSAPRWSPPGRTPAAARDERIHDVRAGGEFQAALTCEGGTYYWSIAGTVEAAEHGTATLRLRGTWYLCIR